MDYRERTAPKTIFMLKLGSTFMSKMHKSGPLADNTEPIPWFLMFVTFLLLKDEHVILFFREK